MSEHGQEVNIPSSQSTVCDVCGATIGTGLDCSRCMLVRCPGGLADPSQSTQAAEDFRRAAAALDAETPEEREHRIERLRPHPGEGHPRRSLLERRIREATLECGLTPEATDELISFVRERETERGANG